MYNCHRYAGSIWKDERAVLKLPAQTEVLRDSCPVFAKSGTSAREMRLTVDADYHEAPLYIHC
jgi:hypothetical protein